MTTNELIFHSRPRAEADWECPRKRYYAYDFEGGIVKDNLTLELFIGTIIHDAMAGIAFQYKETGKVDIVTIAKSSAKVVLDTLVDYAGDVPAESFQILQAKEQSALVEGLIMGFYKNQWPALISQYPEIVAIEKECLFPHDYEGKLSKKGPFVFMAKPDLILRGPDGLVYIEYKSTSNKKIEWIESWEYAIQVHATMKAIEFTLGEEPLGTIIQGLHKGSSYYGKFSSPLVYAYEKKGNPPFSQTQISAEYKAGFRKAPIWEMEGGVSSWVDKMPSETLSEQFPLTPMIFPKLEMATDFFRQRAVRETNIQVTDIGSATLEDRIRLLDENYPQSWSKCKPAWGYACNYLKLCHTNFGKSPLEHGFIQKSRDHEEPYFELARELLNAQH